MNITVPRKEILALLERVAPAADAKSALPVLASALLTAEGRTLRIAATDLFMAAMGQCEAEVEAPGVVALPAKDLLARCKAMPDGPIQITTTDGAQATVKAVGQPRRYTLHGLPGTDFPLLPKASADTPTMTIPASLLAMLMARTHFSISTDETRAHVNSALLQIEPERLRMVSTDGHRLTLCEARADVQVAPEMLIPLRAVSELRKLCGDDGDVSISREGPNAFFAFPGLTYSVKLVDAQFPPWAQVIPRVVTKTFTVPRLALLDAVRAVQLAAAPRTGGILLTAATGILLIASVSPEGGNAQDEIPIDYAGAEVTIGLNAKYLLDVLGATDDDEVELGLSGDLDPAVVRPARKVESLSYLGVIMPMRV